MLNVLTPSLKGKRPVMVYIHGGGFASGSGVIALAADAFAREEDVVLVSLNHRLNVFGYTYLGEFSQKSIGAVTVKLRYCNNSSVLLTFSLGLKFI